MICFSAITNPKLIPGKNKSGHLTSIPKGYMVHFSAETKRSYSIQVKVSQLFTFLNCHPVSKTFRSISHSVTETISPHWKVNLKISVIQPLSAVWINQGGAHAEDRQSYKMSSYMQNLKSKTNEQTKKQTEVKRTN